MRSNPIPINVGIDGMSHRCCIIETPSTTIKMRSISRSVLNAFYINPHRAIVGKQSGTSDRDSLYSIVYPRRYVRLRQVSAG